MIWRCVPLALLLLLPMSAVRAATVSFAAPSLDRWNYPFAGNGAEEEARIFSALGTDGFDERDATFLLAFNTVAGGSAAIPTGLGAAGYTIQSVKVTATVSSLVGAPTYDGTHDTYTTYLPTDAAGYVADGDVGRPIELFGAGFAAGYSEFGFDPANGVPPAFEESNAFGFGPPNGRYVHPIAFDAGGVAKRVSNNIDYLNGGAAAFEATPFAAGTSSLAEGSAFVVGTELTFDVNVADPAIQGYLQAGLDKGQLGFVISTLATSDAFPRLFTKEFAGGSPVTLEIEYTAVPEPGSVGLLAVTLAGLSCVIWGQMRRRSA